MRDREALPNPVYWNAIVQTSPLVKNIYGSTLKLEYNLFFDGRMRTVVLKKNWLRLGKLITNKIIKDKFFFNILKKRVVAKKRKIITFLKSLNHINFQKLPLTSLIDICGIIKNLFIDYDAVTVPAWFIAGDQLRSEVQKRLNLTVEEISILSLPTQPTFTTMLEKEVLKYTISRKNLDIAAQKLANKYYWIPFGYDGPKIWDARYFLKLMQWEGKNLKLAVEKLRKITANEKEIKRKSALIINKYGFTQFETKLLKHLQKITYWTDERKALDYQLFYQYHKILKEIGCRLNITTKQLKYIFLEELNRLYKTPKKLALLANQREKKAFAIIAKNGHFSTAKNFELKRLMNEISTEYDIQKIIKGQVASKGSSVKYRAPVKILLSPNKCHKIKKGDIIIATMTSPEYLPAMQKAIGFITDEGGVTCHAAIVAREMKKPCIIGAKIATKIFKDGDLVEVNTNKGIIKKINSHG